MYHSKIGGEEAPMKCSFLQNGQSALRIFQVGVFPGSQGQTVEIARPKRNLGSFPVCVVRIWNNYLNQGNGSSWIYHNRGMHCVITYL
jgi:hypothetical protein